MPGRAALLVVLTASSLLAQTAPLSPKATDKPAYESNPKFTAAISEARDLERRRMYTYALDSYKKANKIAGGSCVKCLDHIYDMQMGLRSYKDAIQTATLEQSLAATPADKSIASGQLGRALLAQGGDKPKPDQLAAAHNAFQEALTAYPKNLSARYSDGCVLTRMGKMDDAKEAFTACSQAASPKDPMRVRAAHFAENPELSLHKMAPAFEVTALDGTRFTLDNMTGHVVLIDFWATWCGPCNEELPNVQKMAKEFAGEPLTIISISWDSDEAKWKDFIGKHNMTWLQYRDADHSLSERFGVNAIPHYFTVDSDGVLTAEILGGGNDVEGKLKKLLKRAKESKPTTMQETISATN